MSLINTFSSFAGQSSHPIDRWNAYLNSAFPGIVVDAERDLRAQSATLRLGDLGISRICSNRATVHRWTSGSDPIESGRVKLHIQINGVSTTTQRGRTVALSKGEGTFVLSDEPYEMDISDRNEMFVIEFSPATRHLGTIAPGGTIDRGSPVNGLLRDMMHSLFRQRWDEDRDSDTISALAESVMPLVSLLLGSAPVPEAREQSDLRRQILAYIDSNISDSALRTGRIAGSLGVLPRDVQAVFSELATTPTAYIIDRRLSLAAQRLSQSDSLQPGLTTLACDLGFSDAAHFCRRFKSRFGISPGAYARGRAWH